MARYSITNQIKNLTEQKDKKDEETAKPMAISSDYSKKSASDVLADLKDIEKEVYSAEVDAPESLGLTKKESTTKTDEDFINEAKAALGTKYADKKASKEQSFAKQVEELLKQNEQRKQNATTKEEQINAYYDSSMASTENQALKRGLARSSIIISELANIEGSRAKELSDVMTELTNSLQQAEVDMAELERQKQEALENLDIEYALALEDQINKSKADYQKQQDEIIEFNNNVEKLEAEYKLKRDKQATDKQKTVGSMIESYGWRYEQMVKDKQYDYLKQYLTSLDHDYAVNLLKTNKAFKEILGNRYEQLLGEIS